MKNKYKHDCDNCKLIGVDDIYDYYLCKVDRFLGSSLIARRSDKDSDYWSCPVDLLKNEIESIKKVHPESPGIKLWELYLTVNKLFT